MEATKDVRRSPSKTNSKLNIGSGKMPPKREHRSSKSAAYAPVFGNSIRSGDDDDVANADSVSDVSPAARVVDLLEPDYEGLTGSTEFGKKVCSARCACAGAWRAVRTQLTQGSRRASRCQRRR